MAQSNVIPFTVSGDTGFKKFGPVTAGPNPMEAVTIYRAQSLLTKDGKVGPLLSYNDAVEVLRKHNTGEL